MRDAINWDAVEEAYLQQVLELGYDEFSNLVKKEIERIVAMMLPIIGANSLAELDSDGLAWIRARLNALDLVFKINRRTHVAASQNYPDHWPSELRR